MSAAAARAAGRHLVVVVVAAAGGSSGGRHVGGAALGRAAPLDEAAGVELRLQRGRGEDVGGQPPQLVGPRLTALLIQLQQAGRRTNQRGAGWEGRGGGRGGRKWVGLASGEKSKKKK